MTEKRIETLQEILARNPEAKAYWHILRERIAERWSTDDAKPVCETCGGLGSVQPDVPINHPAWGKLYPCPNPDCEIVKTRRDASYAKLCTLAQIPSQYQSLTFAAWDALCRDEPPRMIGKWDALGAALAFVAARRTGFMFDLDEAAVHIDADAPEFSTRKKNWIVYSGVNGVGKTSLAVSIARALLDDGVAVIYMRMMEFFDGLKDRFKDKPEYGFMPSAGDEAELLTLIQQIPVLIIDEFPRDVTDWRKERAEQLVNYRYTHQLPTIITTNLTAGELETFWGLTTCSRIQNMAHWIAVGGVELRVREGAVKSR